MQFALLIYESPEAFAARNGDGADPYTGAWRAYHKALVESGTYLAGDPLEVPETGTTVRLKEGKRRVQDGPFADTPSPLLIRNGSISSLALKERPPEGATKRRKRAKKNGATSPPSSRRPVSHWTFTSAPQDARSIARRR
jgi:hypothetical protein